MRNGDGPVIDARDGVFWRGGEVDARGEGDDGKQPLQASHEPAGLLQHAGVHHCCADWLEWKGKKININRELKWESIN